MAFSTNDFLVASDSYKCVGKDASEVRALLDLEIGTDVQAQNTLLQAIATAGTLTDGGVLIGNADAVPQAVALGAGQLLVGQSSGDPLAKTISGDMEVAADGVARHRLDLLNRAYRCWDIFGDSVPTPWASVVSTGSSITCANGEVSCICDDDLGDHSYLTLNIFDSAKSPHMQAYVKTDVPSNNFQAFVGYGTPLFVHSAVFRSINSVNSGAWLCVSKDGSTEETTDSGVAPDSYHLLEVRISSASSVTFYIDGVLKATHTTRLPSSASMAAWIGAICKTATTGTFKTYTKAIAIEHNR